MGAAVASTTTGSTARPVAAANRAGSRFCRTGPLVVFGLAARDTPAGGSARRPLHGHLARGRRRLRQHRARCLLRDPAAIDENDAAVGQGQRRHDMKAGATGHDPVVDEDLPRSQVFAGGGDGAKLERRPIRRRPAGSRAQRARHGSLRRIARAALPSPACGPSASCPRRCSRRRDRQRMSAIADEPA